MTVALSRNMNDGAFDEIKQDFLMSLVELKDIARPTITGLASIAAETINAAPAVVDAIAQHILMSEPAKKLPALYLADCIMKTVGGIYVSLFSSCIVSLFTDTFLSASEPTRHSLIKLLGTWRGSPALRQASIFSQEVIQQLDSFVRTVPRPRILAVTEALTKILDDHILSSQTNLLSATVVDTAASKQLEILESLKAKVSGNQLTLEQLELILLRIYDLTPSINVTQIVSGPVIPLFNSSIPQNPFSLLPAPLHNLVPLNSSNVKNEVVLPSTFHFEHSHNNFPSITLSEQWTAPPPPIQMLHQTPSQNPSQHQQYQQQTVVQKTLQRMPEQQISKMPMNQKSRQPTGSLALPSKPPPIHSNLGGGGGVNRNVLSSYEKLPVEQNSFSADALALLYPSKARKCSQCGRRFRWPADQELMESHMDWHFRINRKTRESTIHIQSRLWFSSREEWASNKIMQPSAGPSFFASSASALNNVNSDSDISKDFALHQSFNNRKFSPKQSTNVLESFVGPTTSGLIDSSLTSPSFLSNEQKDKLRTKCIVPRHTVMSDIRCFICRDTLPTVFDEDEDDWVVPGALVRENGGFYHFKCWQENPVTDEIETDDLHYSNSVFSLVSETDQTCTPSNLLISTHSSSKDVTSKLNSSIEDVHNNSIVDYIVEKEQVCVNNGFIDGDDTSLNNSKESPEKKRKRNSLDSSLLNSSSELLSLPSSSTTLFPPTIKRIRCSLDYINSKTLTKTSLLSQVEEMGDDYHCSSGELLIINDNDDHQQQSSYSDSKSERPSLNEKPQKSVESPLLF